MIRAKVSSAVDILPCRANDQHRTDHSTVHFSKRAFDTDARPFSKKTLLKLDCALEALPVGYKHRGSHAHAGDIH
jgi:hypothetical protein